MKGKAIVLPGLLAAFLMLGGLGCEEQEGPAERAGEKIDEGMGAAKEKVAAGDAMKDAGKKMKDAAEDAKP